MTMAVCIRCGAAKFGAWTPCRECEFVPDTDEDMAKSVILSDHHVGRTELKQISELIKGGGEFEYPQELLKSWLAADFESVRAIDGKASCLTEIGCVLALVVVVVGLALGGGLLVYWIASLF